MLNMSDASYSGLSRAIITIFFLSHLAPSLGVIPFEFMVKL